jgi:hypothetical protein
MSYERTRISTKLIGFKLLGNVGGFITQLFVLGLDNNAVSTLVELV